MINMLRWIGAAVTCVALLACNGKHLSSESKIPADRTYQLMVDPQRYDEMTKRLDELLGPVGIFRQNIPPGLDELKGRRVLFLQYLAKGSNVPILIVHDLSGVGRIEVELYLHATSQNQRELLLARIPGFLNE